MKSEYDIPILMFSTFSFFCMFDFWFLNISCSFTVAQSARHFYEMVIAQVMGKCITLNIMYSTSGNYMKGTEFDVCQM